MFWEKGTPVKKSRSWSTYSHFIETCRAVPMISPNSTYWSQQKFALASPKRVFFPHSPQLNIVSRYLNIKLPVGRFSNESVLNTLCTEVRWFPQEFGHRSAPSNNASEKTQTQFMEPVGTRTIDKPLILFEKWRSTGGQDPVVPRRIVQDRRRQASWLQCSCSRHSSPRQGTTWMHFFLLQSSKSTRTVVSNTSM